MLTGSVFISGALSEIGKEVARTLASEGCSSVFLADVTRDETTLAQLAADIKREHPQANCQYCAFGIGEEEEIGAAVKQCVEAFGRIDYAVNVVNEAFQRQAFLETSAEDFDAYAGKTMVPLFFYQQYQVRQMMQQKPSSGSIVNVASVLGLATTGRTSLEASGQHGVVGFSRAAALDCAALGIRVNCVCPGSLESLQKNDPLLADSELTKIPTGRLCQVSEVVGPVLFLLSRNASGITGHCLPVDGGWMLRHV